MNTILASVTEQFLGSWVAAALVIIAGVGALFGIVEFFATKREVKSLETRVTTMEGDLKELYAKLDRDKDALLAKMDRDKSEILAAGSTRANNLHIRIDELDRSSSAMSGHLKTISELFAMVLKKEINKP